MHAGQVLYHLRTNNSRTLILPDRNARVLSKNIKTERRTDMSSCSFPIISPLCFYLQPQQLPSLLRRRLCLAPYIYRNILETNVALVSRQSKNMFTVLCIDTHRKRIVDWTWKKSVIHFHIFMKLITLLSSLANIFGKNLAVSNIDSAIVGFLLTIRKCQYARKSKKKTFLCVQYRERIILRHFT